MSVGCNCPKLYSSLKNDMVHVLVGPRKAEFILHRAILRLSSVFFKEVLSNLDPPRPLFVANEKPAVFEAFANWLYHRTLPGIDVYGPEGLESPGPVCPSEEEAILAIELYIMAEQWGVPHLKDDLMGHMKKWDCVTQYQQTCHLIPLIYCQTPEESPLRLFMANLFLLRTTLVDQRVIATYLRGLLEQDGNHQFVIDCFQCLYNECGKTGLKDSIRWKWQDM